MCPGIIITWILSSSDCSGGKGGCIMWSVEQERVTAAELVYSPSGSSSNSGPVRLVEWSTAGWLPAFPSWSLPIFASSMIPFRRKSGGGVPFHSSSARIKSSHPNQGLVWVQIGAKWIHATFFEILLHCDCVNPCIQLIICVYLTWPPKTCNSVNFYYNLNCQALWLMIITGCIACVNLSCWLVVAAA